MTAQQDASFFKEFERAGWGNQAPHYAALAGRMTADAAAHLLDAAGVTAGDRILDVACGPGYVAGAALERGATVVGIDFVPAMVAIAADTFPGATFSLGDAEELDFDSETFDAVLCAFGVNHFAEPERAFAEACRVLRPGGRYAFTVWDFSRPGALLPYIALTITEHGDSEVALPPGPAGDRFADADACTRALTAAGFAEVHVQSIPIVWRAREAAEFVQMVERSTVRLAWRLQMQPEERRAAIEAALVKGAEQFRTGDGYEAPCPATLVCACKP